MRPRSLRWRLGLLYAAVIAVALLVTLGVVNLLVERALIDNTAARLEVEAGLIAPSSPGHGNAPVTSLAAPDLARVLGGQQTAVVILDPTGVALASETNGALAPVVSARLDPTTYQAVLANDGTIDRVLSATGGGSSGRVLVVAAPIRFETSESTISPAPSGPQASPPGQGRGNGNGNGKGNGNGRGFGDGDGSAITAGPPNAIAQLAISLDEVDATLGSLRMALVSVGVVALLVALLVIFLATAVGLRPLRRVAEVADRVAAGDLSARAGLPSGGDEIGRLGRAFDRMIGRLEGSFVAQRQFAADASHELRTPLTVLGGYVDVLAKGTHEAPATTARILGSMRREIDRLSRLAADLLLLTQLEAGGGRLNPERLDVGDLLADLGAAARVIGDGRRIDVERAGPLPVVVDRDRLTQALLNLVDNAVRHAPEGGVIRLSGRREERSVLVEVFNEGSAISPEHLTHLFERFYRADRSLEPGRHAGLGLAIVKAIVQASGGAVSAVSDATGTRFVVRLPVDPAAVSQHPFSPRPASLREAPIP